MRPTPDRLPSRPLRNWFLAWHIYTGDPPKVIAKGFDLDISMVAELLSRSGVLMMESEQAMTVCRQVQLDPAQLWEAPIARQDWETIPLEPALENLLAVLGGSSARQVLPVDRDAVKSRST